MITINRFFIDFFDYNILKVLKYILLTAYIDKAIKEIQLAHVINIITRNDGMDIEDKEKEDLFF